MDDLGRAWAILGLAPGSSPEAVKACYRDLVRQWHPDKFQGDQNRLDEAAEMLKEINWAYDYLSEHAFAAPPQELSEPQQFEPDQQPKSAFTPGVLILILSALVLTPVVLFLFRSAPAVPTLAPSAPSSAPQSTPVTPATQPAATQPSPPSRNNILAKMLPAHKLTVVPGAEGLILIPHDLRDYLQTPRPLRPPFVFKTIAKIGTNDFRFHYGLGIVIFNHWQNPPELYSYDIATGNGTGFPGKGAVTNAGWTEFTFDVRPDQMIVSVDGEVRLETKGYYQNLNTAPGVGPFRGEVIVKSVEIEPTREPETPPADAASTNTIPGNLLASMKPIDGLQVSTSPEGTILTDGPNASGYFQTIQTYKPPFTIRTRAKTDALNLRLYCGKGMVIFNWEPNPGELRVHDPLTAAMSAHGDRGRILPNEFHDITWEILSGGMVIMVDGQVRFQNRKDYSKLNAPAAIGPYLSKLTLASFLVEQK